MQMLGRKLTGIAVAAVAVCLYASSGAYAAASYNISDDWSSVTSSPGPWSYGEQNVLGGTLTNYQIETDYQGGQVSLWNNPDAQSLCPAVFHNNTNQTITAFNTVTLNPFETIFHPGNAGQYSVIHFTAPTAGAYKITSAFGPRDLGRTDVFILANGSQLFSADLATDPNASFTGTTNLAAGQTVEFAVSVRPGTQFYNDSTAIDATIAAVPEAATSVTFGLLFLAGLFVLRNRKRISE